MHYRLPGLRTGGDGAGGRSSGTLPLLNPGSSGWHGVCCYRQVYALVRELLAERMPTEQAGALADKLSTGTWTHDYPITAEEAKQFGLPVRTDIPAEV